MFKWTALGIGVSFLAVLMWMVNDMRLQVRRTTAMVNETTTIVKETGDTLNDRLPEILQRTLVVTEAVSELAMDVRNLKSALGKGPLGPADEELSAYAKSALETIEKSGATIGLKASSGKGLKKPVPAREWVARERREVLLLTRLSKSKKDLLMRLVTNVFRSPWHMQFGDNERVPMLEWLKKNHPPTKALFD